MCAHYWQLRSPCTGRNSQTCIWGLQWYGCFVSIDHLLPGVPIAICRWGPERLPGATPADVPAMVPVINEAFMADADWKRPECRNRTPRGPSESWEGSLSQPVGGSQSEAEICAAEICRRGSSKLRLKDVPNLKRMDFCQFWGEISSRSHSWPKGRSWIQ